MTASLLLCQNGIWSYSTTALLPSVLCFIWWTIPLQDPSLPLSHVPVVEPSSLAVVMKVLGLLGRLIDISLTCPAFLGLQLSRLFGLSLTSPCLSLLLVSQCLLPIIRLEVPQRRLPTQGLALLNPMIIHLYPTTGIALQPTTTLWPRD